MNKILIFSALYLMCASLSFAQTQPSAKGKTGQKIVKSTEKAMNTTNETAKNTTQISQNMQTVSQNVKEIVRIFEPFKVKAKKENQVQVGNGEIQGGATYSLEVEPNATNPNEEQQNTNASSSSNEAPYTTPNTNNAETTPSGNYNSDGSANLGTQNHATYGNFLDMNKGEILDNITAPSASQSVDLIFTATKYSNDILYAFFSPYFAKNSHTSKLYNYGTKYKRNEPHPASSWDYTNESQVALTNLSAAQFDKFTDPAQVAAYVKQVQNFKEAVEIKNQVAGKILAIKTQMDNRTTYGLLYITEQFGTVGENSYVKVKLKVGQ